MSAAEFSLGTVSAEYNVRPEYSVCLDQGFVSALSRWDLALERARPLGILCALTI